MSYPAIGGKTTYNRTTFANFVEACGKKTFLFSTNPSNGDISHPTDLQDVKLINVAESMKVFIPTPTTKWINPSDCVDMDCDALRKILIKDIDGSFFGTAGGSLVSRSEYQWDGNRRFGLGKPIIKLTYEFQYGRCLLEIINKCVTLSIFLTKCLNYFYLMSYK